MKFLKALGTILLIAIIGLLIASFIVKKDYEVKREVEINLPKQQVFDFIKDIKNQNKFSVWNMKDPNMKQTETGTPATVGFIHAWDSENEEVGKGEQEIKKIVEGERIDMELRFKKPMEMNNNAYMATSSIDSTKTKVTWGFNGHSPWPWNTILLFINMDDMLGPDLANGLGNLKALMEKPVVPATVEPTK